MEVYKNIRSYRFNSNGIKNVSMKIENSTALPNYAFYYCTELKSVTIPNSVTVIGDYAFQNCSSLTSVVIPNSITSIGNNAFKNCIGLKSVIWDAINYPNFTSSSSNPFYNIRTQITSFEFGDNVQYIPQFMCQRMSNLTSIIIPDSVIELGYGAFEYSGLTSVKIGNSVTKIGDYAFFDCTSLISITIPNSVTSIKKDSFSGCSGLTSIIVDDNNKKYDSRDNCNAIIETETNSLIQGCKNTIIPNSVTSIGEAAFYKCTSLTSITIPNSVISIGNNVFQGCTGLISIVITTINPPTLGSNAFYNTQSSLQIYVPDELVNTYKTATDWSSQASKIKPLSEKPA